MLARRCGVCAAALIIVTVVLSSCSRNEAPAEPAAAAAAAAQLEAEVGKRFRRPALQGYLMLPDSFVGGSFPNRAHQACEKFDR